MDIDRSSELTIAQYTCRKARMEVYLRMDSEDSFSLMWSVVSSVVVSMDTSADRIASPQVREVNVVAIIVAVLSSLVDQLRRHEALWCADGLYRRAERSEVATRAVRRRPSIVTFRASHSSRVDALLELLSLSDGRLVSGAEKLLIFLNIVGQGSSVRVVQESLHHSRNTVSRVFHEVIDALILE